MNRTTQGTWWVVLCSVALAGCADQWNSKPDDNSGYTSRSSSVSSSATPATSSANSSVGAGMSGTDTAQASYGMVQAIDSMQRQDLGMGAVGAAAAGGARSDPVYRVTVRLDDGSSQTMVLDAMPAYKVGDRVRYSNGAITPY